MITHTPICTVPRVFAGLLALLITTSAIAHPGHGTNTVPGFRPPSDHAAEFIASIDNATIAVLPPIVRRLDRTACSYSAQAEIMKMLSESGPGTAVSKGRRLDFGGLNERAYQSQWEEFEQTMTMVGDVVKTYDSGTDYVMVMEFLSPEEGSVFGIEIYIIRKDGHNAFSFLLNSHHAMFSDAHLFARDSSEDAREEMLLKAARLGITALRAQIAQAAGTSSSG